MGDSSQKGTPQHIAIIMDGNGRWAKERRWARTRGHREGAKRVDDIVTECAELGVKYLTLYTFSTENWNRPNSEVNVLMRLLVQHLRTMDKKLLKNKIHLTAQGSLDRLPKFVQRELDRVRRVTSKFEPKLTLNLALSYGGREEIIESTKKIAEQIKAGTVQPQDIDEKLFQANLYHPEIPDPDLLIRTGGEWRISNFLLWEIAYSELYVTETLWPDFREPDLHRAIAVYQGRERRFGKTSEQVEEQPQP